MVNRVWGGCQQEATKGQHGVPQKSRCPRHQTSPDPARIRSTRPLRHRLQWKRLPVRSHRSGGSSSESARTMSPPSVTSLFKSFQNSVLMLTTALIWRHSACSHNSSTDFGVICLPEAGRGSFLIAFTIIVVHDGTPRATAHQWTQMKLPPMKPSHTSVASTR